MTFDAKINWSLDVWASANFFRCMRLVTCLLFARRHLMFSRLFRRARTEMILALDLIKTNNLSDESVFRSNENQPLVLLFGLNRCFIE
jgi:hypothetical protein